MDHQKVLEELGLTSPEAKVYLALLETGPSSVLALSRRTELKRPTLYLILDSLSRRGLVSLVPGENKRLYLALSPEFLAEELARKTKLITKALPGLTAHYQTHTGRPSVIVTESRDGILGVYRDIAANREKNKEVLSFFSIDAIPPEFEETYDIFINMYRQGKIHGREIVYTTNPNHRYLKNLKTCRNYEVRYTTDKNKFLNDSFIYGNKVAFASFQKRFALIVESSDIADSLRSLFNLAWQNARSL